MRRKGPRVHFLVLTSLGDVIGLKIELGIFLWAFKLFSPGNRTQDGHSGSLLQCLGASVRDAAIAALLDSKASEETDSVAKGNCKWCRALHSWPRTIRHTVQPPTDFGSCPSPSLVYLHCLMADPYLSVVTSHQAGPQRSSRTV